MNRFVRMAAVAAGMVLAGCGWKQDGLQHLQELYGAEDVAIPDLGAGDPGGVDTTPADVAPPDTAGQDVPKAPKGIPVRITLAGSMSPLGSPIDLSTVDYFIAKEASGTYALTFCGEISTVPDNDTSIMASVLTPASVAGMADTAPALPRAQDGGVLAATLSWNWGLKDPADTQPLPTDAKDGRLSDPDGNGKPGFTVELPNMPADDTQEPPAERYMVKRVTWNLSSASPVSGRVAGDLTFTLDQNSLGSTSAMANQNVPVSARPTGSGYVLRLDQSKSCAELMAAPDAPFAP